MPPATNRSTTPMLLAGAVILGLLVVGGILLVGGLGGGNGEPSATAPTSQAPAATASGSSESPEAAVHAFFAAFAAARATDDPSGLRELVTSEEASAFLTVEGFLEGQKAAGKASVVTEQRLENVVTEIDGSSATVAFDFTEAGYDIRLADASPLESPQVLPARRVTVTLRLVDGRWLVDAYESSQ